MSYPDLDPDDWDEFRRLGHRMLDDMVDHLAGRRDEKVWQPMPDHVRDAFTGKLPHKGISAAEAYAQFQHNILPYGTGNTHPRFMGWVHGGGNAVGMLAEMLAAGLNANLGGRSHAPILVERQVIAWSAEMLGFPADTAGGLLVTGTSIANLIAILAARTASLGTAVRQYGLAGAKLTAYTSSAVHGCVSLAMDMAGFGANALRMIPVDDRGQMRIDSLRECLAADRDAGDTPFLVVGTAGTVNTGAVDELSSLAALCRDQKLWFHVDAAFGALAMLSPVLKPKLAGIEQADSVAFDFHKWGQAPYDAGCVMVRDQQRLFDSFAQDLAYLRREQRGLAGDHPWPCDMGPDLSRGFRALKIWMALQAYGADHMGAAIEQTCQVAQHLAARVAQEPRLELLAPVALNIVCFRYIGDGTIPTESLNSLNAQLVVEVQEAGRAAPSSTTLDGRLAIRAAFVNHRVRMEDAGILIDEVFMAAQKFAPSIKIDKVNPSK